MNYMPSEMATLDYRAFAFIITLAAVVNGLGIARWLTDFADYLRQKETLNVKHYWLFNLSSSFHFLLHILLWWTLWSIHDSTAINFLTYLYLLIGPVLLYLGTTLLSPRYEADDIDLRAHLLAVRRPYSTILTLVWIWAICAAPVLREGFRPTLPLLVLFLAAAVAQRLSDKPWVMSAAVLLNWLVLAAFVGLYSIELDAIGY